MLKVDEATLSRLEQGYPGIREDILHFEQAILPKCSHCGSADTARVQFGLVGRLISIASATTKITIQANQTGAGKFFCNQCRQCFDEVPA